MLKVQRRVQRACRCEERAGRHGWVRVRRATRDASLQRRGVVAQVLVAGALVVKHRSELYRRLLAPLEQLARLLRHPQRLAVPLQAVQCHARAPHDLREQPRLLGRGAQRALHVAMSRLRQGVQQVHADGVKELGLLRRHRRADNGLAHPELTRPRQGVAALLRPALLTNALLQRVMVRAFRRGSCAAGSCAAARKLAQLSQPTTLHVRGDRVLRGRRRPGAARPWVEHC